MPGLSLAVHETACSYSKTTNQMCLQQSQNHLTEEEQLAAEESFSLYCKPVELYNIIQRRAIRNPSFLQRCLLYKIHAKKKNRIQISVSISGSVNSNVEPDSILPFHVLLARPDSAAALEEPYTQHSTMYQLSRTYVLASFSESGTDATFVIPDVKKFPKNSQPSILFISLNNTDSNMENCDEDYQSKEPQKHCVLSKFEGKCYRGAISVDMFGSSLDECVALGSQHKIEMTSTVSMSRSFLDAKYMEQSNCLTFFSEKSDSDDLKEVQVRIQLQGIGVREMTSYDSYTFNDIPISSLPYIRRLRAGNVLFNYRYYNNSLQKTEATEDFTCPFCLVQCASFKGLRCHLTSCHDLFNFEFWVTEEYQAVNVSVGTDPWRYEIVADGVDPRLQTFFYRSKFKWRRRSDGAKIVGCVHPHIMELDSPNEIQAQLEDDCLQKENATCSSHASLYPTDKTPVAGFSGISSATDFLANDCLQPLNDSIVVPTTMLQFGKTRKISAERTDPRNRQLLRKRQFFHSHRAQPMALEQVLSDRDSEDEIDDDIADFEDRRMLDDFVDVTKDEKQVMHLWNSFVRKQRVLADGHIPWACEAFSRLHGQDLIGSPALLWCWRFFMIKLWNHSLLDAGTMNNCNVILDSFQTGNSDPMCLDG